MSLPVPLRVGDDTALDHDASTMWIRCVRVQQRNWSRVATADPPDGNRLFVKQFRHRDGIWDAPAWLAEQHGAELAAAIQDIRATQPVGRNEAMLTLGYPWLMLEPPDALLRSDQVELERRWPDLCHRIATAIHDCATSHAPGLPTKERAYRSAGQALCFKGFEARNLAWTADRDVVFFDVGKPYLGPVEEAVARMVVSALLLNWGRPLSRFASGPPLSLADQLAGVLPGLMRAEALSGELARQFHQRSTEPKASTPPVRAVKGTVIKTLGRRYLDVCKEWCLDQGQS